MFDDVASGVEYAWVTRRAQRVQEQLRQEKRSHYVGSEGNLHPVRPQTIGFAVVDIRRIMDQHIQTGESRAKRRSECSDRVAGRHIELHEAYAVAAALGCPADLVQCRLPASLIAARHNDGGPLRGEAMSRCKADS